MATVTKNFRIKSGLIYTELIKANKIEATDELVKAELEKIAKIQDMDVKDLEKNINKEQFNNMNMPVIQWSLFLEDRDNVEGAQALACTAGGCEI